MNHLHTALAHPCLWRENLQKNNPLQHLLLWPANTPRLNSSKEPESFTHNSSTPLPMKRKSSKKQPSPAPSSLICPCMITSDRYTDLLLPSLTKKMSTKIHILIHTNHPTTTQTLVTYFAPTSGPQNKPLQQSSSHSSLNMRRTWYAYCGTY